MITVAVVCLVLAFLASICIPSPGPALTLAGIAALMLAARFLP